MKNTERILILTLLISIIVTSVSKLLDDRLPFTFTFDNRQLSFDVRQIAVAGDFNNYRTNIHFLADEDKDSIWQTTILLSPGWHDYRFVLNNGERWLRDSKNRYYGGIYSNSMLYVSEKKLPEMVSIHPATGSWLYLPVTNGSIKFSRSLADSNSFKIDFRIDNQTIPFTLKDSLLMFGFVAETEGEHHWELEIKDLMGRKIFSWDGLWHINYSNQPPVADAGYTQFAHVGQIVQLNGGKSFDPDFEPIRCRWKFVAGAGQGELESDDSPFPKFVSKNAGRYQFQLTVRDSLGEQATDMTEVILLPEEQPTTVFTFDPDSFPGKISTISLVGEFNQWRANLDTLVFNERTGLWEIDLPLPSGQYEYKFVVNDNRWIYDPSNPVSVEDGWKGLNSVRKIERVGTVYLGLNDRAIEETGSAVRIPVTIDSWSKHSDLSVDAVSGKQLKKSSARWKPDSGIIKTYWFGDIQNPDNQWTTKDRQFIFQKSNKQGSYFFYCLADWNGHYPRPLTILINHYKKTECLDFSQSPAWADTSIVYEIYLRRFTREGTFQSLIDRLDYLKNFGVNVLWLLPVTEGNTEHGYAPINLFDTESDYGSIADYHELIDVAHQKGMKVIFDFVANHLSDQHRFVHAAAGNTESPLRQWFHWRADGGWGYHNDWDNLINLNFNSTMVRHYILDVARFWLSLGVDGFRCDVAWAIPHDFWKDFRREIKKLNPACLLINEVLPRQPAFHDNEFDMSYDTDFYGNVLDVCNGRKSIAALNYGLEKTAFNYPSETKNLRYLENHDLPRFLNQFNYRHAQTMAALLFTLSGTPLIYYGQELGLTDMRPQYPEKKTSKWVAFYQELIKLRQSSKAFTHGSMETVLLDTKRQIWQIRRAFANDQFNVFVNLSKQDQKINLPAKGTILLSNDDLVGSSFLKAESFIIVKL